MNFGEVITAMVTPFNENFTVDFQRLEKLVYYLMNNGTDAIIVTGTTGESPTLTMEEKIKLYEKTVKYVGGKIPVIAGTSTYSTKESIFLTKEAERVGVNGIMAVTPYYNRPNQAGLYQHFIKMAEATKLPMMLYNVPSRTGVNIEVETVIKLSEVPNITSIKEASGDLEAVGKIIANTPEHFTLYSGDDSLTLPILSIGGFGVVSVASHVFGHKIKQMITNYRLGNIKLAANLHKELLPFMMEIFNAPSPAPIKFALNNLGIEVGSVREPLVSLTEKEQKELLRLLP